MNCSQKQGDIIAFILLLVVVFLFFGLEGIGWFLLIFFIAVIADF